MKNLISLLSVVISVVILPSLATGSTVYFKGTESPRFSGTKRQDDTWFIVELTVNDGAVIQRTIRPGPPGKDVVFEGAHEVKRGSDGKWTMAVKEKGNEAAHPVDVKLNGDKLQSLSSAATSPDGSKFEFSTELKDQKTFVAKLSIKSPTGTEVFSDVLDGKPISKDEFDLAIKDKKLEKYDLG
ncbi:MAG: hypothetical protein AAB250_00415, partial [Bdellovibrionota bacterium]